MAFSAPSLPKQPNLLEICKRIRTAVALGKHVSIIVSGLGFKRLNPPSTRLSRKIAG